MGAEPRLVLAEVRVDDPRLAVATATAAADAEQAAAAQAETARAAKRRMLLKERATALVILLAGVGLGWLQWDSLVTKNEVNLEAVFLTVVLGLIGPAGLVSPRLMVGMGRKPGRVSRRYRILGTGYAIVAVVAGVIAMMWIGGLRS